MVELYHSDLSGTVATGFDIRSQNQETISEGLRRQNQEKISEAGIGQIRFVASFLFF